MRSTLSGTARQARRRASAPILNPGLNSVAHFCPSVTPRRRPGAPLRRRAPAAPRVPMPAPRQDRKRLRMLPMQYGAPLHAWNGLAGAPRALAPPATNSAKSAARVLSLLLDGTPIFSRHWLSASLNGRFLISCRRPADCKPPAAKAAGGAGATHPVSHSSTQRKTLLT